MKSNKDRWTLVLVGKWNKHILAPEWVAKNIFDEPTLQVEFSLNFDLPTRYTSTTQSIRMLPLEDRVVFQPLVLQDECLTNVENKAIKLLELLSFTPMTGVGVNFGFDEKDNPALPKLFNIPDNSLLGSAGYEIEKTVIKRKLRFTDNELNLKLIMNQNEVTFDLNYNYSVKSASEAIAKLRNAVLENKKRSSDLIKSVYSLDIESEAEHGENK